MKIASIGIGNVGFALANHLQQKGHTLLIAHDDPQSVSVQKALSRNAHFQVLPVQEAVDAADLILLAVPFRANEVVLKGLQFKGKTLVDCTNPVGPGMTHGLKSEQSGSEFVQALASDAQVVKAYSIYGYENFADTAFPGYAVKPVMLIAGDDAQAKGQVKALNDDLGFETLDTGALSQALHLEHMTLLWVNMVRMGGLNPHLAWAYLH